MKAITAYVNCEYINRGNTGCEDINHGDINCGDGSCSDRVLVKANVSTVADFRQLLKKALSELDEIRRDIPDCPLSLLVDYVKLDDAYTAELSASASENRAFNGLSDQATIEELFS
jgi:hypothetical protein